jgi:hypothetical protein
MVAPEAVVHSPVPLIGLLPANIAVVKQVVWFIPATDGVGLANLVIVTVLSLGAQAPFEIVHLNTLAPMPKLDTLLLFEVGLFTVPAPLTNAHTPVPIVATLPFKLAVVAQTDWSVPALEVEGASRRMIVMVLTLDAQVPFEIVQVKVVEPIGKPLTIELAELALLKLTPKVVVDQSPIPFTGTLPAKVVLLAQIV